MASLSFNQDFSCLASGTSAGLKIYNCDPFGECFNMTDGAVTLVEMLFATSLVAVVGAGSASKRLRIVNTKRRTTICELTFFTPILNVKLNRRRLVVVLVDQILIYDVSCMQLLHALETTRNPSGLVALCAADCSVLAYPAGGFGAASALLDALSDSDAADGIAGSVVLYDALALAPLGAVVAHKSALATLALDSEGSLVATALTKGTIIRVFDTASGRRVAEFRRGMAGTQIHLLNFNLDLTLLCCSSSNQTVHIFRLGPGLSQETGSEEGELVRTRSLSSGTVAGLEGVERQPALPTDEQLINSLLLSKLRSSLLSGRLWSSSKKLLNSLLNNYLPQQILSILEPVRHFAFIRLPKSEQAGYRSVVAMNHNLGYVMVAASTGRFYLYTVPPEKGGECVLVKEYVL